MMYGSHFNPLHLKLCKYSEYKINVVKQKEGMLKLDGYGIFQKELIHILIFSCEFIKDAIFFIFCRGFLCFQEQGCIFLPLLVYIHMCLQGLVLEDIDSVNVSMATDYFREFYEENLGGGLKIQRRRTKSKL